ncbi:MAG: M1 family metallopeptidase [Marmoricola sp.]
MKLAFPRFAAVIAVLVVPVAALPAAAAVRPGCATPHVSRGWCRATSRPVRDSVYPGPSHPGVDALHYLLRLRWRPGLLRLSGDETLRFRATRQAPDVPLALAARLHVRSVRLDGRHVPHSHHGRTLLVHHRVRRGSVHTLRIRYAGHAPRALPLARQRNAVGLFHTRHGRDVFTNDEPVGAYTWYAVNDQPSDKAYYDFRLRVPAPRVGVANGRLVSRHRKGGDVLTRFHLDEPAASYLTTVEFGRYSMTRAGRVHGTPVTLWTPRGDRHARRSARYLTRALAFVERRLGSYPFATLSLVVVRGYDSGMENQTLITVGDTGYDTSRDTLVHETVHQWYGDTVTPRDWRDVWMNEGMATYLQFVWESKAYHWPLKLLLRSYVAEEKEDRSEYGPPGDYDPSVFAAGNVYYGPALMWQELREKVGSKPFWSMVRAWPGVHRYHNAGRTTYLRWVQHRLHRDLGPFFHAWLTGRRSPRFR